MKLRVDIYAPKTNKTFYSIIAFTDRVSPDHLFFFPIPINMFKNTLTAKKLMTINQHDKCKWIPYYMIGVSWMPTEDQGQEKESPLIHTGRNWKDKWEKLHGILK